MIHKLIGWGTGEGGCGREGPNKSFPGAFSDITFCDDLFLNICAHEDRALKDLYINQNVLTFVLILHCSAAYNSEKCYISDCWHCWRKCWSSVCKEVLNLDCARNRTPFYTEIEQHHHNTDPSPWHLIHFHEVMWRYTAVQFKLSPNSEMSLSSPRHPSPVEWLILCLCCEQDTHHDNICSLLCPVWGILHLYVNIWPSETVESHTKIMLIIFNITILTDI